MKKIFLLTIAAALSTGCASVEKYAGKAVDGYCEASTETSQAAMRERVDAATDPHTVRIHCADQVEGE